MVNWVYFYYGSNGWVFYGDEENNFVYVYYILIFILLFLFRNKLLKKRIRGK